MSDTVEATGYLVVLGERSSYGAQNVIRAKVRRITQGRPLMVTDEIAVKLTVRVPAAAFGPFKAAAVIEVPEDLVAEPIVEVTVEDPNG